MELTAKQRQAVTDLGVSEEEWDLSTWQLREHDFSKLKPAEVRAATALGFESKSWHLFAALVRSNHAGWLKRNVELTRANADKSASNPGKVSAHKRGNHGTSSSKASASLGVRPKRDVQGGAEGCVQGTAVVGEEGVDDTATVPPELPGEASTSKRAKHGGAPSKAPALRAGAAKRLEDRVLQPTTKYYVVIPNPRAPYT